MIAGLALRLVGLGLGQGAAKAVSWLVIIALAAAAIAAPVLYVRHVESTAFERGKAAGVAESDAGWQVKYVALDTQWRTHTDAITADLQAAREAERDRLERAAAEARAMGNAAVISLYESRRREDGLQKELDDERDADPGADALCGTDTGGVLRYNRAIGAGSQPPRAEAGGG